MLHSSWGAASTPFGRIVAPHYADGHGSPRGGWQSAHEPGTTTGNNPGVSLPCNRSADALLPNPRRVSKVIHTEESHPESRVRILRGLPHMTFTEFLYFLTPSSLFVSKIYTVRNFCAFFNPLPLL